MLNFASRVALAFRELKFKVCRRRFMDTGCLTGEIACCGLSAFVIHQEILKERQQPKWVENQVRGLITKCFKNEVARFGFMNGWDDRVIKPEDAQFSVVPYNHCYHVWAKIGRDAYRLATM